MEAFHCEKEQEVLEAARAGKWATARGNAEDDPLRRHVAGCPVCADVVLVVQFLQQEDETAKAEALLPGAGLIWWKGQLLAKRAAAERAIEPIAIVEKVACACGILSLLGVGIWRWPQIYEWVKRFIESRWWSDSWGSNQHWVQEFLLGLWGQPLNYLLMMSVGGFLLFMVFLLYAVWVEE